MIQTLTLPVHTHRLSQLLGNWRVDSRRTKADREAVGAFSHLAVSSRLRAGGASR